MRFCYQRRQVFSTVAGLDGERKDHLGHLVVMFVGAKCQYETSRGSTVSDSLNDSLWDRKKYMSVMQENVENVKWYNQSISV